MRRGRPHGCHGRIASLPLATIGPVRAPSGSFLAVTIAVFGLVTVLPCGCGDSSEPNSELRKPSPEPSPSPAPGRRQTNAMLPGRWITTDWSSLTRGQLDEIARLEAIGYVSGSKDWAGPTGVTVYRRGKTFDGFNFYTSGHGTEAILIDMDGQELHRWSRSWAEIFPGVEHDPGELDTWFWRRALLHEDGSIVAIFEGKGIFRLDVDSNVLWANPVRAHHDAAFTADGDLYTLTREAVVMPEVHPTQPILEDFLTRLDGSTGKVKEKISLLKALAESDHDEFWLRRARRAGDVMHVNSIEILDGRLGGGDAPFLPGRILLSSAYMHLIFVVDPSTGKVVWARQGSWRGQHDPGSLDNGNVLVFDNGIASSRSRILEVDPLTGREEVVYEGTPDRPFYTKYCGAVVRLPNGNTMISETDSGRAFEISDDGEIVWEFYNPERAGDDREFIAALTEVTRIPKDLTRSWLEPRVRSDGLR